MPENSFQPIKNPYVVGNPIKSRAMFFGRKKDFSIIKEWIVTDGLPVILLIGDRRSGKTSMLMQIYNGRLEKHCEAVFCDFHAIVPRIQKDEDFPLEIGRAILKNNTFQAFENEFFEDSDLNWGIRLQRLLDQCIQNIKPKKLVILCDEFERLEKLFEDGKLSIEALSWVGEVLNKPIFFVMSSSREFKEKNIRIALGHVTQKKYIYELSQQDAYALIEKPVGNKLYYDRQSVEKIYRLSGGHTFFTQYVCQTLINHVNAELKKNHISVNDLDDVIEFMINNPTGHIQETWRRFSDPQSAPRYTLHVLACLANTIEDSEEYVNEKKLLKIKKVRNFVFSRDELYSILAWLKNNTRLIQWKSGGYRFRIDLIRLWVAYSYQTGAEVDEYLRSVIQPEKVYNDILPSFITKNTLALSDRMKLDSLLLNLNLSYEEAEKIENNFRTTSQLEPVQWGQEYKKNCAYLKNNYSGNVLDKEIKRINSIYVATGRLSKERAKEVRKLNGIRSSYHKLVSIIILSTVLLGGIIFYSTKIGLSWENERQTNSENTKIVKSYEANLYNTADLNTQAVETLALGSLVTIIGKVNRNNEIWYHISFADQEGWILADRIITFDEKNAAESYALLANNILQDNNSSFLDLMGLVNFINQIMVKIPINENNQLRKLYLESLQKSLNTTPLGSEKEMLESWLKIHSNSINKRDDGKYILRQGFINLIETSVYLYGKLNIKTIPPSFNVTIKDEAINCNNDTCKTPLLDLKLRAGKKTIILEKDGLKEQVIINLHPNQTEYIMGEFVSQ